MIRQPNGLHLLQVKVAENMQAGLVGIRSSDGSALDSAPSNRPYPARDMQVDDYPAKLDTRGAQ
ncbi:hypothetical protein E4U59_001478 [Claviceps monticola]|nr:hypothetical protein E4U59_001478 [Claviceps monticola]